MIANAAWSEVSSGSSPDAGGRPTVALTYPLLNRSAAGAFGAEPPTFPGQVGDAVRFVTPAGTVAWAFNAYAGPRRVRRTITTT